MMEKLILEPKTLKVQVKDDKGEVVKTFTLREMPASKTQQFFRFLNEISTDDFSKEIKQGMKLEDAFLERGKKVVEFVSWLLGEDVDMEFIEEYITSDMIVKIIMAQNTLNGMDDFLKKVGNVPAENE